MSRQRFWSLNRLVVLVLVGGFATLLVEIRALHQDVLGEHRIAWAPIVYSGVMAVAGLVGLLTWERGGRRLLFWAFALGLVIGPVGFWYHNGGHPVRGVEQALAAWRKPVGDSSGEDKAFESGAEGEHASAPPTLAPLAFAGLGMLGMLACSRRLQPGSSEPVRGAAVAETPPG
jgi:hypothetical protein